VTPAFKGLELGTQDRLAGLLERALEAWSQVELEPCGWVGPGPRPPARPRLPAAHSRLRLHALLLHALLLPRPPLRVARLQFAGAGPKVRRTAVQGLLDAVYRCRVER
jgi:hypothetical protein